MFAYHKSLGFLLADNTHSNERGLTTWQLARFPDSVPEGYSAVAEAELAELISAGYKGWNLRTETPAERLIAQIVQARSRVEKYWECWEDKDGVPILTEAALLLARDLTLSAPVPQLSLRDGVSLLSLDRKVVGHHVIPWNGVFHSVYDGHSISVHSSVRQAMLALNLRIQREPNT